MLEQLMQLVKQNAGDAIVNNQAIPNQHNDAAIQEVTNQIFNGLKGHVAQGNLQQVTSLFQGSGNSIANNPMVSQIVSSIAGNFATKFGVSQQSAQRIASSLIPTVMNQLVNKTNDPNDRDFDLQDMMRGFSGNQNLDIGSIIGQVAGSNPSSKLGGIGNVLGKLFGK